MFHDLSGNSFTSNQMGEPVAHTFPRGKATVYGIAVGVLVGIGNTYLDLDFTLRLELLASLGAAIIVVLVLHEGVHGAVGVMLGHKPTFGVEPPLVYTTFREKIPCVHFVAIALAPLLALDAVFIALYAAGVLPLFMDLCFAVNTIGAVGDVWIVLKLVRHPPTALVQDTKTGVVVYHPRSGERARRS
jgi:hypothetical protein